MSPYDRKHIGYLKKQVEGSKEKSKSIPGIG